MGRRIAVNLLAVLTVLANSLCACAGSSTSVLPREPATTVPPSHCQPAASEGTAKDCHSDEGAPADDAHGSCGHCNGTVIAAGDGGVVVPTPALGPVLFRAIIADPQELNSQFARVRFDHTGLSPPVLPTTLLSLFCSLNN